MTVAARSVPEAPLTKGCQMWRWIGDQACCFLASLGFPFALRGYANEGAAHEAPRQYVRGSSDGTGLGSTIDSRKVGFFVQAVMPL
jgi:hypothetical protein